MGVTDPAAAIEGFDRVCGAARHASATLELSVVEGRDGRSRICRVILPALSGGA
jgi:hypothetical protein